MSGHSLSLAFSPCPNDTFIFEALVNGRVADQNFKLSEVVLEDVETLNRQAITGKYDITKISFHAFAHVSSQYVLLTAGSALGRGCGPLLVANEDKDRFHTSKKIAIPGKYTTAAMLLKLYDPSAVSVEMPFDQIMPAVVRGDVDAGVIIHESRFTYKNHGLAKVVDLGEWWEQYSDCPIPLGGIAIRRTLAAELYEEVETAIRKSLTWAQNNYSECMPYIEKYAQEIDHSVIKEHIKLYVNNFTFDLGKDGESAVYNFLKNGNEAGLFNCDLESIFSY